MNGDTSSPAVISDGVSYSCPNIYKFDPATGAVVWHYAPGCSGGGGKTPALVAMGGELEITARFPDGAIRIQQFEDA
jgi:outer membrane protein assembly factor BamB